MNNLSDFVTREIKEPGELREYIDFICTKDNNEMTKRLVFHQGVQRIKDCTSYCTKARTMNIVNPPMLVSCCEKTNATVIADNCRSIAFRISLDHQFNDWTMSIVLEKRLEKQSAATIDELKSIKTRLFTGKLNEKTFWESDAVRLADMIYVEFQWTAGQKDDVPSFKWLDPIVQFLETKKEKSVREVFVLAATLLRMSDSTVKRFQTGEWGMKKCMPQVITLNHKELHCDIIPKISEYHITDKIDGMSFVCIIHENRMLIGGGKNLYQFDLGPDAMAGIAERTNTGSWVFDAEGIVNGSQIDLFPFDVSMANGVILTSEPYMNRYSKIRLLANCTFNTKYSVRIFIKRTLALTQYKNGMIEEFYNSQANYAKAFDNGSGIYRTDGLIFIYNGKFIVDSHMDKNMYLLTPTYKWKRPEDTTIDFYVIECPRELLGKAPYVSSNKIYLLCSGLDGNTRQKIKSLIPVPGVPLSEHYNPVLFSPGDKPYMHIYTTDSEAPIANGTIAEFAYVNGWQLRGFRQDRQVEVARGTYFGNDHRVAELNKLMIDYPITIRDIDFPNEQKKSIFHALLNPPIIKYMTELYTTLLAKLVALKLETNNIIDIGVIPLLNCFNKSHNLLSVCENPWQTNQLIHERYIKVPHMGLKHYYITVPDWTIHYDLQADIEKRALTVQYRRGINVAFICLRCPRGSVEMFTMIRTVIGMLSNNGVLIVMYMTDSIDANVLAENIAALKGRTILHSPAQDIVRSNEIKLPLYVGIYQFEVVKKQRKH